MLYYAHADYIVRPVTFQGWGVYAIYGENRAKVIYTNESQDECYKVLDAVHDAINLEGDLMRKKGWVASNEED